MKFAWLETCSCDKFHPDRPWLHVYEEPDAKRRCLSSGASEGPAVMMSRHLSDRPDDQMARQDMDWAQEDEMLMQPDDVTKSPAAGNSAMMGSAIEMERYSLRSHAFLYPTETLM